MANYIQFTKVALVDTIVRLKNSRNGNPRFLMAFTNGLIAKTKVDAGFAYAIHSGMTLVTIKYHFTPKGNCILDDILEGEYK